MKRRQFLSSSALIAIAPSILLEGCSFSVTGMVNTILSAAQAIIAVAEPTAPWLSSLQSAIAALKNAETQWSNTGTVSIIIDALNTLEAVLAVIPLTEAYSPLIDVIVAGVESILAYFAPASLPKLASDPHRGRVTLQHPHAFQTYQGAFRDQFNSTAKGLGLVKAVI